jgi:hypothetical protein
MPSHSQIARQIVDRLVEVDIRRLVKAGLSTFGMSGAIQDCFAKAGFKVVSIKKTTGTSWGGICHYSVRFTGKQRTYSDRQGEHIQRKLHDLLYGALGNRFLEITVDPYPLPYQGKLFALVVVRL